MSNGKDTPKSDGTHELRTRFDGAHSVEIKSDSEVPKDQAGQNTAAEQMQAHAAQLASRLQERQCELDKREAELNAHAAHLEREKRNSRLWLQERQHELADRQRLVEQKTAEAETKAAQVSAAEIANGNDLEEKSQILSDFQSELQRRQTKLEAQAATLAEQTTLLCDREAASAARAEAMENEFSERCRIEAESQRMLDEHLNQLEADRKQLDADRRQLDEHARNETAALAEAKRISEQQVADKRQQLESRAKKLEEQEAAAQKVQDDVTRMHREAIEARLIVEQLWSELSTSVRPAELTASMSHIRRQLVEHYKYESESIAHQKDEILAILERLDKKQVDMRGQRSELQDWVARRHVEIEEQAARLVAREQELDRQEQHFKKLEHDWAQERRMLQLQIRQLAKSPEAIPA